MKILKKILVGFGVIFVLLIAVIIFVAGSASEFKEDHEQFVKDFTREFSQDWEIDSLGSKVTNDLLSNIRTTKGKRAIAIFRSLGKLVDITDIELRNYNANAGGPTTGVFSFKASFENAKTVVTVTVRVENDEVKVQSFHVNPTGDISKPKEVKA